jgi:hypothetical protein
MRSRLQPLLLLPTSLLHQTSSPAQISSFRALGDCLFLQRNLKIPACRNADPGALIIIKLENIQETKKSDQREKWQLRLPVFKLGRPYFPKITTLSKMGNRIVKTADSCKICLG